MITIPATIDVGDNLSVKATVKVQDADWPAAGTPPEGGGTAGTVQIGSVTALAAGAPPTVTNSGTPSAAVLDFGIPAAATPAAASTSGGGSAYSQRPRIYRADMSKSAFKAVGNTVFLRAGAQIEFMGVLYAPTADVPVLLPTLLPGRDYAISIKPGSTATDLSDLLQAYQYPDVRPAGAEDVGGFHFLPGNPATGLDTGGGWTATLLEWSVWDISFRPKCDPRGMTRIGNSGKWVDIYFQGNSSCVDGVSRNNDPILHGTNPPLVVADYGGNGVTKYSALNYWTADEHLSQWGKHLPSYLLMCKAAFGTNEGDGRGFHPINTGLLNDGHAGSSDPNFTSKWGCIQVTGCLWHWCADLSYFPGTPTTNPSGFESFDMTEGRGKLIMNHAQGMTAILHGGQKGYTTTGGNHGFTNVNGSRAAETLEKLWDVSESIGIRGACDHLSL